MIEAITRCLGLVTQFNPLTTAPGALAKADNSVIRREDVIENRRGYALYASLTANLSQLMAYLDRVLAHYGTKVAYDDGSGTFTDYSGTYSAPTGKRMRFAEVNSNLMVTTSEGVKVFTDVAGTQARKAGAPRALDPDVSATGSTGFLGDSKQVAYRVVIVRTDANSNTLIGYPSQRAWISNSSGNAVNVDLDVLLPSEAQADDVIEVYRTQTAAYTASDEAGDEMFLAYQYTLSASDISTGSISFTDSVVDALLGAALYTNVNQQGLQQANERPPLCKDLALYKSNFMFYANTETKQRLFFSLVSTTRLGQETTGDTTSASDQLTNVADLGNAEIGWHVVGDGIPAGTTIANISGTTVTLSANATATAAGVEVQFITNETLTLAGSTYSFAATQDASNAKVQVFASGVAADDIDRTARSLVHVINRYSTNTSVYAYYLSGPDDLPGQILIEERGVGGSSYTLQTSDSDVSAMFFPEPPVAPSTASKSTSSNSVQKNYLYYSKNQQPEHVPLLNYVPVGPANRAILRIATLRDSLIIIKEEGVYRLTGDGPPFVVTPLDLTVFCKSEDSVVVLSNLVFMLSNQGVVAISDNGVQVISREIEPELLPLLGMDNLSTYTVGCAYESERSYLLATVSGSSDTEATQIFVYNTFTRAWTRWTFGFNAAIVENESDRLYFSKTGDESVFRERKDFADTDYADPEATITITDITGDQVTFTAGVLAPEVGYEISQGGTGIKISELLTIGSTYKATMASTIPSSWEAGSATLYPNVGMDVEWQAWSASKPELLKQVSEFQLKSDNIAGNSNPSGFVATFRSNFDDEREEVPIEVDAARWGGSWGTIPWGGGGDGYSYRTWVPRNKQYCSLLNPGFKHINANEKVAITGCAMSFRYISERVGR